MLKTVIFLLSTSLSIDATCRGYVPLSKGDTCGPDQTMFNEGLCTCCYYDTKNIPTIGVGFNLQRSDAAQVLLKYGLKLADVLKDCFNSTAFHCLTIPSAKRIFLDVEYPEAQNCVDNYATGLPTVVRAAVTDVAFAGCGTLNKFVKMRAALIKQDWKAAADELQNSLWCGQVGQRCDRDYNCIANYGQCTGQTCGHFKSGCLSNHYCYCFQTKNGGGFCGYDVGCGVNCTSISCPLSAVCITNTCCGSPVCVPLSAKCKGPSTNPLVPKFSEPASLERLFCQEDKDCSAGRVCKQYSTGRYCE